MNYIENDKNESVIAVGAPGSIARVTVQYPKLLEKMRRVSLTINNEALRNRVHDFLMCEANVEKGLTRQNLLVCAGYASSIEIGRSEGLAVAQEPAFKVTLESGKHYFTAMNEKITVAEGLAYLWQCSPHITENEFTGKETLDPVASVECVQIGWAEARLLVDQAEKERIRTMLVEIMESTDKTKAVLFRFSGIDCNGDPSQPLSWNIISGDGVFFHHQPCTLLLPRFISHNLKNFIY